MSTNPIATATLTLFLVSAGAAAAIVLLLQPGPQEVPQGAEDAGAGSTP
jgi:hypothetical protein